MKKNLIDPKVPSLIEIKILLKSLLKTIIHSEIPAVSRAVIPNRTDNLNRAGIHSKIIIHSKRSHIIPMMKYQMIMILIQMKLSTMLMMILVILTTVILPTL